ncbi:MAG: S8/S53 family peptidase, partial [Pseudomonadota bacterium]
MMDTQKRNRASRSWPLIIATGWLGATFSAGATSVDWQLVTNTCPRLNTDAEISCGRYGRFYLDNVPAPSGCSLIVEGSEEPPRYFPVRNVVEFPVDPVPWEQRNASTHAAAEAEVLSQGAASQGIATQAPSSGALGSFVRRPEEPWLTVIDFSGAHGESVRWLAEAVAEQPGAADVFWLDTDTDRDEVSDMDVVRQLCAVVDRAAIEPWRRPVINLSFGRPIADTDPVGNKPCVADRLACQIRRITQHIAARHGVVVASAGVQREWLFPAALPEVIGSGMLDTSAYLSDGVRRAAWEMPVEPKPDALAPGNSLCLRGGWAAPSGASYATAVLSGWFLQALTERPG